MTPLDLEKAIDQAWTHTQKTAPGPELDRAKSHLDTLRKIQQKWALHSSFNN